MISVIIVDDEEKSRKTLHSLLTKHCPAVKVLGTCASVDEAVTAIEKHGPDLVFLDIEMPFHNGFNLLERIKNPGFEVVFVTAYDRYAIQAIKYNAMDYLMKPINVDELKLTIRKFDERGKRNNKHDGFEALLTMIKTRVAKISVPTFEGLKMVNSADIIKCVADDTYTTLYFTDGKKLMVSKLLKDYEDLLEPFNFFRIHNSVLVNLAHVTKYIKGDGGSVLMSDGEVCEVSRRKKNELMGKLSLILI